MTISNAYASIAHLDRQILSTNSAVQITTNGAAVTWTIPYSVAVDGTQGHLTLCRTDTNVWLEDTNNPANTGITVTRQAPTSITVVGLAGAASIPMLIGLIYPMSYQFSTIYMRNQKGGSEQRGRLRIGYINLAYLPSTNFQVVVTPQGRPAYTYTFYDPTAQNNQPEIQPFRFPVQCRNEDSQIVLQDSTPGAVRLVSFDWEGELSLRAKPV